MYTNGTHVYFQEHIFEITYNIFNKTATHKSELATVKTSPIQIISKANK